MSENGKLFLVSLLACFIGYRNGSPRITNAREIGAAHGEHVSIGR